MPGDVSILNYDRLILSMIMYTFKEQTSSQERELKSLDINVDSIVVPSVRTDGKGDDTRDETVEVEEEEQCSSTSDQ